MRVQYFPFFPKRLRQARVVIAAAALVGLGACSAPADLDPNDGIHDPYETQNRKVHAFNRGLDRSLVRPAARGYSSVLPDEIEASVSNFATNLDQPSVFVNSLLQGDLRGAGLSGLRFLMNTTAGMGGFIDAATEFNVPQHSTDFGETLSVWGAGEGAYVELPFLGPSTTRDATGRFVDLFTNPLGYVLDTPESSYGTAASIASGLGNRGRFSDTVDSILYESADSYAQLRLIYLQSRRFELGETETGDSTDPYADPYEDPYAE